MKLIRCIGLFTTGGEVLDVGRWFGVLLTCFLGLWVRSVMMRL